LEKLLKSRKIEERRILQERGVEIRKELDLYCQRTYGLTLQKVFISSDKPLNNSVFIHPETGEEYTYPGTGKLPNWVKNLDPTTAHIKRKIK
jgi:hypothetical protein